jgi:peptidoglycan/xylan/chitin deacetylase (PgdA/CDA1 family)
MRRLPLPLVASALLFACSSSAPEIPGPSGNTASCGTPSGTAQPNVLPAGGTTVVTLTFDDTFSDTYAAGAMLESHGMRGVFFLNSPRFTFGSGYMTLDQALALQKNGHEIGGHTLNHPHLPTLDVATQQAEICNDRANLLAMGLNVQNFAYPFGEADCDTEAAALYCNYDSARGVGDLRDSSGHAIAAESLAPPDLFKLRANASIVSTNTLDDMESRVNVAENAGGGWVIINMHHVCDGCSGNAVSPSILGDFLDWLAPRTTKGTYVRLVREVVGGAIRPAVSVSGATTGTGTGTE